MSKENEINLGNVDVNGIRLGITRLQVEEVLGPPSKVATVLDDNVEILVYECPSNKASSRLFGPGAGGRFVYLCPNGLVSQIKTRIGSLRISGTNLGIGDDEDKVHSVFRHRAVEW